MPHESWLATELLLFAVFVGLLVIAAVCCDTVRAPEEVDLDGEERP
jgi:hypothetical protein